MILTPADRYAIARCWGLWRRWETLTKFTRATGGRLPSREQRDRLIHYIRQEMRDDEARPTDC